MPLNRRRDHPRVCGEHRACGVLHRPCRGSSPRVRGTQSPDWTSPRRSGIIPACAGNTTPSERSSPLTRDHPRVCGEHIGDLGTFEFIEGSSPRVRGTRLRARLRRLRNGIIPACAGNTSSWLPRIKCLRDHPRVCGEHITSTEGTAESTGSSPRVRGTQGPITMKVQL